MSRYTTLYRDRRRSKAAIRPRTRPCDTATVRHDMGLGAVTLAATPDTARAHGFGAGCVAIQPATRPAMPATRPAKLTTWPSSATTQSGRGPRHGSADATTWRPARCVRAAWVQWARRLGSGCALGAPNLVLTQCTVLSHCLGHCS